MPRNKRNTFYIDITKKENEITIIEGVKWLLAIMDQFNHSTGLLAIPVKKLLDNRSVITTALNKLDRTIVKEFLKNNKVQFSSRVELILFTEKIRIYNFTGPILAIFPTKKLLDKLDDLYGVTDILVIPWYMDEVREWIRTWAARELGDVEQKESKIKLNQEVVEALEELTEAVNLSTGIGHPSDRRKAIETFEKLVMQNISFDPMNIRAWLVAEGGWQTRYADEVVRIAKIINEGRKPR